MKMTVKKISVFPANKSNAFALLQRFDTLAYIAKPYATFKSNYGQTELVWEVGRSFSFDFKMFGFIALGVHAINVRKFNPDNIYTNEGNPFCPVWNHRIILKETADGKTEYTDEVKICAGWKTPFVYLWAKAFYSHRQKKWIKLLNQPSKEKEINESEMAREYKMNQYLEKTPMLDFSNPIIQKLIETKRWKEQDEFDRLKSIYNFVRDEVAFGYNIDDRILASKVLKDGYGQCNTKGTLFMALLRGCGIPCRVHGFTIDK